MRLSFIKMLFIGAFLGAMILFLSIVPCFAQTIVFQDMDGHWAEDYVTMLVEKNSISGMPDGLFHPDDKMSFPEFVTIIIASKYGKQEPVTEHWASGYMKLALENNVIESGDMRKQNDITRFEAVRVAFNALTNIYEEEEESNIMIEPDFLDLTSCFQCQTSYSFARQCHVKGIISGRPSVDGPLFEGNENLTRAEGCVIIMKMLEPTLRTPMVPDEAM